METPQALAILRSTHIYMRRMQNTGFQNMLYRWPNLKGYIKIALFYRVAKTSRGVQFLNQNVHLSSIFENQFLNKFCYRFYFEISGRLEKGSVSR